MARRPRNRGRFTFTPAPPIPARLVKAAFAKPTPPPLPPKGAECGTCGWSGKWRSDFCPECSSQWTTP